jgi:hypothetical protein
MARRQGFTGETHNQHRVLTGRTELARNSYFYILPFKPRPGDLAAIAVGARSWITIGRWYPQLGDHGLIIQPELAVHCTGAIPIRILGLVVPCEPPPKPITNLRESQYEWVFENPFPRWLDS